jgi:hypothetical protein
MPHSATTSLRRMYICTACLNAANGLHRLTPSMTLVSKFSTYTYLLKGSPKDLPESAEFAHAKIQYIGRNNPVESNPSAPEILEDRRYKRQREWRLMWDAIGPASSVIFEHPL